MIKIYRYDITTKEFLQELEINEAYGSNLPFTTTIKPLAKKDGFTVCFNDTKWELVEDNRNKTIYVKATKEELKVDYLGKIKDEHTLLIPNQFDEWDYTQNKWIENIEQKETQRIQQIKSKAEELILARYSIIWQLNHPRVDVQYKSDYDFIDNIRRISNEAEANGTALEDINWEVTNG